MGLKRFVGKVVSNRMDKTAVVAVPKNRYISKYKRTLRVFRKYKAHDETNSCNIGDIVQISETRPLSKTKRWRVTEMLKREKILVSDTAALKQARTPAAPGAPQAAGFASSAHASAHGFESATHALASSLAGIRLSSEAVNVAVATAPRGWRSTGSMLPFAARW